MKEFLNEDKAFSLPFEAYYAEVAVKPITKHPYIMIGFYCEDGGTEGEFKIEWNNIGIQLHAFDDSWLALSKMPELIELMAYINENELKPSIEEFSEMLKEKGYKDITKRVEK